MRDPYDDEDERDLESPLSALRARLGNINELTQTEVDFLLQKLRAKAQARIS